MRLRLPVSLAALGVIAAAVPISASAHENRDHRGGDHGAAYPGERHDGAGYHDGFDYGGPARDAWLADCRARYGRSDNGVGGAVIGGVVGGIAGNRIAGNGNRTAGTIAGTAVGAVAGAAIDRAEDAGTRRDACEAMLDEYYASYAHGEHGNYWGNHGRPGAYATYAPAYGPYAHPYAGYSAYSGGCCGQVPIMMMPVMRNSEPECTETVEYVYEDVPARPRVRYVPEKRRKIVPDKRVRMVPDKRQKIVPTK